jgi:hypothetical protein
MSAYDILHHYCDLNEMPYHVSRDVVIDYMIQNPTRKIQYMTPYGRIFDLVHQFVRGDVDLELVMTRGDMGHTYTTVTTIAQPADCLVYDSLIASQSLNKYHTMIEIQ